MRCVISSACTYRHGSAICQKKAGRGMQLSTRIGPLRMSGTLWAYGMPCAQSITLPCCKINVSSYSVMPLGGLDHTYLQDPRVTIKSLTKMTIATQSPWAMQNSSGVAHDVESW
ncbi:unnamed protein product [Amoebophrya sp. A120]|nr:unnamed protein product [Amoebophrya sp. A120]|eukprot:GSA120T00015308001.1